MANLITFEEFWDERFGEEYGTHEGLPCEPFYSIAQIFWEKAEEVGFQRQEAVTEKYGAEIDALNNELLKWKGRRCC